MTGELFMVRIEKIFPSRHQERRAKKRQRTSRGAMKRVATARGSSSDSESDYEELEFEGRWCYLPENTHTDRQAHHGRREVFISNHIDKLDSGCLYRRCHVYGRENFRLSDGTAGDAGEKGAASLPGGEALVGGDDTYFSEYLYDTRYQRFRRIDLDNVDEHGNCIEVPRLDDDENNNNVRFVRCERRSRRRADRNVDGDSDDGDDEEYVVLAGDSDEEYDDTAAAKRQSSARRGAMFGYDDDNASDEDFRCCDESDVDEGAHGSTTRAIVLNKKRASGRGGKKGGRGSHFANRRANVLKAFGSLQVPAARRKAESTPMSVLDRARIRLTLACVPDRMPCREQERGTITRFLQEALTTSRSRSRVDDGGAGRCIYISGVPGTGKTATVLEVMRNLEKKVDSGDLDRFRFVEINSLRLPSPHHLYSALWEALTGQLLGPGRAATMLEEKFGGGTDGCGAETGPKRAIGGGAALPRTGGRRGSSRSPLMLAGDTREMVTVLLVDEIDLLVTSNQSVLYSLFDWPTRRASNIIVIGIANTMDLPERMLPRVVSRLSAYGGLQRLTFSPYTQKQLQQIIKSRLTTSCAVPHSGTGSSEGSAFDQKSLEYASRKVAAVSGDVRRALELCRRAVEMTIERGGTQQVGIGDVNAAVQELSFSPHIRVITSSPIHHRVMLAAIVMEMRFTGIATLSFISIAERHRDICRTKGYFDKNGTVSTAGGFPALCCSLDGCRTIAGRPNRHAAGRGGLTARGEQTRRRRTRGQSLPAANPIECRSRGHCVRPQGRYTHVAPNILGVM